jgi:hypothetical protein
MVSETVALADSAVTAAPARRSTVSLTLEQLLAASSNFSMRLAAFATCGQLLLIGFAVTA